MSKDTNYHSVLIDFVKILVLNPSDSFIYVNPLLCFVPILDKLGEIKKEVAEYKGLKFIFHTSGRTIIQGSLHKYWNDGEHNYNDFGREQLKQTIDELSIKFELDPNQCIVKQMEFGININPPLFSEVYLDGFFMHQMVEFVTRYANDEGNYRQAEHQQYWLKIYDKAKHYINQGYQIKEEILRLEMKYISSSMINKLGVCSLADLTELDYVPFLKDLIKRLNECIFYDFTIKSKSILVEKFKQPSYWKNLKNVKKATFKKQRNRLKKFRRENSNQLLENLCEEIEVKSEILME